MNTLKNLQVQFANVKTANRPLSVKTPAKTKDSSSIQVARRAVANVATTIAKGDYIVAYTSLTATRAVTLPAASTVPNQVFIIKDEAGTAGTNAITIVGTVNGAVNPSAISANYGSYTIYSNGTAWFTIS